MLVLKGCNLPFASHTELILELLDFKVWQRCQHRRSVDCHCKKIQLFSCLVVPQVHLALMERKSQKQMVQTVDEMLRDAKLIVLCVDLETFPDIAEVGFCPDGETLPDPAFQNSRGLSKHTV